MTRVRAVCARLGSSLALVAAFALSACGAAGAGTAAFSPQFADNQVATFGVVMNRLPPPREPSGPANAARVPLAVVATHEPPRQLVALDVRSTSPLWSVEVDAQTRPEILGDLVLTSDRHRVIALDLSTGRVRWQYPMPDLAYVGADRDGDTVYLAFTVGALGGARREGHIVAVDARSGSERWRHQIRGVLGQPAAAGDLVVVPYERQSLSFLEEATGRELARLRSTDDVIAWARRDSTGIYYGHRGIYRLTHDSVHGVRSRAMHVEPPIPSVPPLREGEAERPVDLEDDGFLPKPGSRSARGRIRLYFSPRLPEPNDEVAVVGDSYYFVYYRYVFALALDGSLRWARILTQDVIGAQAIDAGLFVVGEQGEMRVLGVTNGEDAWSGGGSMQLSSVGLDVAKFPATPTSAAPKPLREALNEIVLDPDNRLVAARAYAVRLLAALPDPDVTRDLLDLYQQRSMPRALRDAIAAALRTRTTGNEHLIDALSRRYDFIEGTEGPPLEVIVPSLIETRASRAVPGLVQQMQDHETSPEALVLVVRAVAELGDASVVPALRNFLVLYRADSSFAERGDALAWAARGLFHLGGPEERQLLTALANDSRTVPPLVAAVQGLFEEERRQAEALAAREAEDARRAAEEAARQANAALPTRLTQEQIDQAFAEHTDSLRECIAAEVQRNPLLGQVRLVFILTGDGRASEIGVAPSTPELTECMTSRVASIEFPRFRQRRQRASFTVSLRGLGPAATTSTTQSPLEQRLPPDAPWWTWWARRAEAGAITTVGAASGVAVAWWERRPAPERPRGVVAPSPAVPDGIDATAARRPTDDTRESSRGSTATSPGGSPWWLGAGTAEEGPEEPESQPAQPPTTTQTAPSARSPRRVRGRQAPEPPRLARPSPGGGADQPPTAPGAPSEPTPTEPPRGDAREPGPTAPQAPPAAPRPPSPPPSPQPPQEETPWWIGAEG